MGSDSFGAVQRLYGRLVRSVRPSGGGFGNLPYGVLREDPSEGKSSEIGAIERYHWRCLGRSRQSAGNNVGKSVSYLRLYPWDECGLQVGDERRLHRAFGNIV